VKDWEEDLNLLKEQKYDFAMAEHSECKTTTHDGRTIWVVMKVDPARLGSLSTAGSTAGCHVSNSLQQSYIPSRIKSLELNAVSWIVFVTRSTLMLSAF
jgi:hypothetical protein